VLEEHGVAGEEAATLARWAEGSPGRALALRAEGALEVRATLAGVLAGERPPVEAAAALWELDGEFAGATPRARARERGRAALELALAVVRDRGRLAAGLAPDELAHGDLAEELAARPGARGVLEELMTCRADLERNLAPEAVLERALLALADVAPILCR